MSGWAAAPLLTLEGYLHQQAKYTRLNSKALVKSWLSNISRLFKVTSWKSDKSWNIRNKFKCKSAWSHFLCMRYPHRLLCHVHMHIQNQDLLNSKHSTNLLLPPSLPPSTWNTAVCLHLSHTCWPGCHGMMEKKGCIIALPWRDEFSTSFTSKDSTHGGLRLTLRLAPILWLYQSSDIWEVSDTVKKQRPVRYRMLRTESLKIECFWQYLIGLQIIRSEHKYRESLGLVFKQLNTGFSHSYPDVKHTV